MPGAHSLPPELVFRAAVAEATVAKPGNVSPGRDFDDLRYRDFVAAAYASSGLIAAAGPNAIGPSILAAVRASMASVGTNANLGIVLLGVPIAAAANADRPIGQVLADTTVADAEAVYEAIRVASPGGLGSADEGDVDDGPTGTLAEMMTLAADRDRVAAQYANGFADVERMASRLLDAPAIDADTLEIRIQSAFLDELAAHPDTHISRRQGDAEAERICAAVAAIRHAGDPHTTQVAAADRLLRRPGHPLNPGTTADLIFAAVLRALVREWITSGDRVRPFAVAVAKLVDRGLRTLD